MASQTRKTWSGLQILSICRSSSIGISSTCSRPAVSRMTVSSRCCFAKFRRIAADGDRVAAGLAVDRHVDLLAEHFQLIDGGWPLQVGGDEQRLAIRNRAAA